MDVFSYPVLALRRLLLYPPSTRQTSNASGDDLERLDDRSSPNSVPPFHLVIPGHVQVQPHNYTRRPLLDRRAGSDGSPLWTIATGERNMVQFTVTR